MTGVWVYRKTRPEVRKPGEDLTDITTKLALDLPEDAPIPRFTDVTLEAGLGDFRTFTGHRTSQLPEDMGAGLAWGDYDNDGDDDIFLVSGGGNLDLPTEELAASELFENLGDGTFAKFGAFPDTRIRGMGAAWGDYDGDGRLDLAVSGYRALLLFHNRGDRFELDGSLDAPQGYWAGISWADFDNDRDLDLYVCGYVRYDVQSGSIQRSSQQYGAAVPYTLNPASFEPESNLLFRNRWNETPEGGFIEEALLFAVSNPEGRSLSALWHDFDADGRLDLYVANDISDNALLLNRPETFEDAGLTSWVADYRGAMGLAAGDWNRDGDDDLFVTHWLAQENALYDSRLLDLPAASTPPPKITEPDNGEERASPRRLTFSDMAAPLGVGQIALPMVGWGTEFADFDSDGWLDLVVSNGSTLETSDQPKRLRPQKPFLLWNQEGRAFHDIAPLAESLSFAGVGRGLAVSDYDNDGDLDLAIVDHERGVRLLRNDMRTGNWLEIRLRHQLSSKSGSLGRGEGATATAWIGEIPLRRSVTGASYLSQSTATLHFGLGDTTAVDRVEVDWLAGERQIYPALEGNAVWELTEGDSEPRRVSAVATPSGAVPIEERERLLKFWETQRAAMDAMKIDGDMDRAFVLFQEALALNPKHEDSRYYLANLLAERGRTSEALNELDTLISQNPLSHRAYRQRGIFLALAAQSDEDLVAAEAALQRSHDINREETGALLALGELSLLRGRPDQADERLNLVIRTNPRAVGAYFLRGYVAWKRDDQTTSKRFLEEARVARGPEWKPEGTTAEGDVVKKAHTETSPLSRFWEAWDGEPSPARSFADLDRFLADS